MILKISIISVEDDEELTAVDLELRDIENKILQLNDRKEFLLQRKGKLKDAALLRKSESLANRDWNRNDFPWSSKVTSVRNSVFKIPKFRERQLPTINAVLSNEDAILLMPTGGGKSLCYQLPALIKEGLTLVISPLVALMEDQIMALKLLKVDAALLNASSSKEEVNRVQKEMVTPNSSMKLLYVTPEKLAKSKRFMSNLQKCYAKKHLSLVAIDEVHCCSQWGHDFRPDYKYLGVVKAMFPDVPMLGVTATATTRVLIDVQKMLGIQGCLVIKAPFNRPNLFYEVRDKSSNSKECVEELAKMLSNRFEGQSGIIYTTTVKDCEDLKNDLRNWGLNVDCYHAQLDANYRCRVHTEWLSGKLQAVIATIAFGMGIDKPDVRFVIHHALSKSMESYYQESGRAGRDNESATCIMFYRLNDVFKLSSMVYAQPVAIDKLYNMIGYCLDQTSCRRELIAAQFEEAWESKDCASMCDHCRHRREPKQRDITASCLEIYTMLEQALTSKKFVTAQMLVDAWFRKGPIEIRMSSIPLPTFSREAAEDVIAFLLINKYLKEDFQITAFRTNTYLKLGIRQSAVYSGKHKILMTVPGKSLPSIQEPGRSEASSTVTSSNVHIENSKTSSGKSESKPMCKSSKPKSSRTHDSSASTCREIKESVDVKPKYELGFLSVKPKSVVTAKPQPVACIELSDDDSVDSVVEHSRKRPMVIEESSSNSDSDFQPPPKSGTKGKMKDGRRR